MSDKIQNRQLIDNCYDTLIGELNRICVTDDVNEIQLMTYYLIRYLNKLLDLNFERLRIKNGNRTNSTARE